MDQKITILFGPILSEKKNNLPTSPGPLAQTCLLEQPGTLTDPKVQEEEEEEEKVSWSEQSGM